MRLLPRTVRGMVLLAAAAWSAGVGVVWFWLPPRPRAAFTFPAGQWSLAVPGGRAFVLYRMRADEKGQAAALTGPLRLFDVAAGRVVREFLDESAALSGIRFTPDGRHLGVVQLPP